MNDFQRLLDSTERHLLALKHSGARFIPVDRDTLRTLSGPPPRAEVFVEQPTVIAVNKVVVVPEISTPIPVEVVKPMVVSVVEKNPDVEAGMSALRERAMACVKCPHLVKSRKNVVFGVGNIHADLMFVGEAPGADEDAQGEPFVGAAGQLLTKIIKAMGLSRETVYIANILKCRPDTPGQSSGNRKPTSEEMKTCEPYLMEQIDLIRPKVLVALGGTAIEGLLGAVGAVTKIRGRFQTFRDIPLMPTFHPSYLLRNQALTEKRKVWEDMLQVMEKLKMPISQKQRNFFLTASGS